MNVLKFIFTNSYNASKPFVIAEIGHNHKGSLKIAKEIILAAKNAGADAVKFQKRNNKSLFTEELYNQTYDNKNSYGKTYGEHREFLEFNKKEYLELINFSKKINIFFLCTPFDFESVDFLEEVNVLAYKIASADLKNIPLQTKIAKTKKVIFLSTGGGDYNDIDRAVKNISRINKKICIMHCTASYPAELRDMNLNIITQLKKKYTNYVIGLSDHENGIDAAPIAFILGARVFEKHFTLDRSWKGTDHSFSLEPEGLRKLVRNLNRIDTMLGSPKKRLLESEIKPLLKMSKSIVAARSLKKNHKIIFEDSILRLLFFDLIIVNIFK
jgi:N-acetylneuraminate synthase/sialic acid synthase